MPQSFIVNQITYIQNVKESEQKCIPAYFKLPILCYYVSIIIKVYVLMRKLRLAPN